MPDAPTALDQSEDEEDPPGAAHIHRVLVAELGEAMADVVARTRLAHDAGDLGQQTREGLRERKKRLTRQRISDVATALFVVRGFDNVRVSEVAEIVGVSEKTVYNYFPTKESMLFDLADEAIERIATALRERLPGESPTRAVLRAIIDDLDHETLTDGVELFIPAFAETMKSTPALRAAWLDINDRLVAVVMDELAAGADVDPQEPEPMIAARAIVSLHDVAHEMLTRRVAEGLRGAALREAVVGDLERAARLLETGLWSFNLLARGGRSREEWRELTRAADEARSEVLRALRQARSTWRARRRRERETTGQRPLR